MIDSAGDLQTTGDKIGNTSAGNPWLSQVRPRPNALLRVFCFPYAGGDSISIYRKWPQMLPGEIEICPVRLPGRGTRLTEAPVADLEFLTKAIACAIRPWLDKPFAFFGHSMGAILGFELSRYLRKEFGIQPAYLFVSGRNAPQFKDREASSYNLPEDEFLRELQRLNGTPKEALVNPELMKLMIPILRADFEACQTHNYVDEPPLDCPIKVFGGLQDDTPRDRLQAWREQTTGAFSLHMFPGDHFFIKSHEMLLLRILGTELCNLVAKYKVKPNLPPSLGLRQ